MAVDFPAYTRQELDDRARAWIRFLQFNERGIRDADVRPGSDYDIKARLIGSVAHQLQELGKSALRVVDKLQAFGDFARQYASVHGIGALIEETDYQAVKATGFVIARSTTASQAIPAGYVLQHPDGTQFTVDSTGSTSATAAKTFSTGHRSTRRFIFQGNTTAAVAAGEVYEAASGELCAVRGADNASSTRYRWVQLENELEALPVGSSVFAQRFGRVVPVTAINAGRIGNKEAKDVLTFVVAPGTVVAEARIIRLGGGRDALTPSQIQQGIRDLYGTRLATLTLQDIYQLVLETPIAEVAEAYVLPGVQALKGAGRNYVIPLGPMLGLSSGADRLAIAERAAKRIPPPDTVECVDASHVSLTLALTLKVDTRYQPDWIPPAGFSLLVTSATLTRLTFGSPIPAGTFEVGDRVFLTAARGGGADEDVCILHIRITAVGANYIDVDPPLPFVPTAVQLSPGGPYGDDLVAVLYDYFDTQAPYAESFSYPATERPAAVDSIRSAVMSVAGVLDCVADDTLATVLSEGDIFVPKQIVLRVLV